MSNKKSEVAALLARGFVDERRNPEYRWDRTLQYRVNVVVVQHGLAALGYAVSSWILVAYSLWLLAELWLPAQRTPVDGA